MMVRLEGTIKRFIGSSTDEKPTADIPSGSSFLEADTGNIWRYDGRLWMKIPTGKEIVIYFELMITLLIDIREALYNL